MLDYEMIQFEVCSNRRLNFSEHQFFNLIFCEDIVCEKFNLSIDLQVNATQIKGKRSFKTNSMNNRDDFL